jgi:glycerol-3-phosphate acyltransferase PlsY
MLPFWSWELSDPPPVIALTLLAGAMIFYTHRSNISRLINRTENQFHLFKPRVPEKRRKP